MKLENAAVESAGDREGISNPVQRIGQLGKARTRTVIVSALTAATWLLAGSSAWALDGIDLSKPAAEGEKGGCPELIRIKYPFLSCTNGQIATTSENDTWENSRQIPIQSRFIEGEGFLGPDLNQNN